MIEAMLAMRADLEMLKSAFGNSLRVGPVAVVDAKKGFRISLASDEGGMFLSPWYPHPESGGATRTWMPLSEGQIVGIINPSGDPRQGILLRAGFSGVNPPPSADLDANVFSFAGVTMTAKAGLLTIDGNVQINGQSIRHNLKEIGDSHRHADVTPGSAETGLPT